MLKRSAKTAGCVGVWPAGAALAPALLCTLSGCLDLTPIELPETDVNTAPVFIEERVLPRPSRTPIVADIGEGCVQTKFSATLVDYDGDPKLHAKWLMHAVRRNPTDDVDEVLTPRTVREEQALPTQIDASQLLGAEVPGAVVYRDLELELSMTTLGEVFDAPESLAAAEGYHLLELYVSDHAFGPGVTNVEPVVSEGEPRPLVAYTSWVVDLDETDCGALE